MAQSKTDRLLLDELTLLAVKGKRALADVKLALATLDEIMEQIRAAASRADTKPEE